MRLLADETSLGTFFIVLGISFIYGIVHALGPGHGKVLISAYFISQKRTYSKAFKIGYMISIIHAISALSITLVIYYFLHLVLSQSFHDVSLLLTKISGGLIVMIALYLFFEHHNDSPHDAPKNDISLALSAGIVPCPGVMSILLFSIILGKLYVGILAAIAMSIGMGFTISLFAIGSTHSKNIIPSRYKTMIPYIGNTAILFLGLFLLVK